MNWRQLNATLNDMSEAEVKQMLTDELAGAQRVTFVERLHQRYCALRASRERAELMASLVPAAQAA
jgi:hypothetical protein